MAKDPAFLFYSADFMMGAMVLTMEQRGQYITLLSVMHQRGRLTQDEVKFLIGGPPHESLAKKFKIDDAGNWYNERLEMEMAKRAEFTKSRRKSLEIDNGDMVHLYLISDPQSGTTKIGSSKYPELRLKEVQKYKPDSVFVWVSGCLFERINEKRLHDQFSEKRKRYDWFALTKEDIEYIRTNYKHQHRTDNRTVNEDVNVNEDVKKNKKESQRKASRGTDPPDFDFSRPDVNGDTLTFPLDVKPVRDLWYAWKKYRWEKFNLRYGMMGEQADLKRMDGMTFHQIEETILAAMAGGWKNIYPDKQNKNGNGKPNKYDRNKQNLNDIAIALNHAAGGSQGTE